MSKYDLCCVGHMTLDKVITPNHTVYMPGGTTFYCSQAIQNLKGLKYLLVASLAETEIKGVDDLRQRGIETKVVNSKKTLYFENAYGENQDDRTQRVLAKADPFVIEAMEGVEAKVFLLGALLADDFSLDFVEKLASKGLLAVDSQGYLREVVGEDVRAIDWRDKKSFLKHVHFLKLNEMELEVMTGEEDIERAAKKLHSWGVKEVIMTLGSMGSIIYDGDEFYIIPAYKPSEMLDATGCGDTYMAGYLYKRLQGESIEDAGKFGAAMATIKIENSGPFNGTEEDINDRIQYSEKIIPSLQLASVKLKEVKMSI